MIAAKWDDEEGRNKALDDVWSTLLKIALDNTVSEPAALSGKVAVLAEVDQLRVLGDPGRGVYFASLIWPSTHRSFSLETQSFFLHYLH